MTKRYGHLISEVFEEFSPRNCPVIVVTGPETKTICGFSLRDGTICPRHGAVKEDKKTIDNLNG